MLSTQVLFVNCVDRWLVSCYIEFITHIERGDEFVTQPKEQAQKVAELNTLFLSLSDKGQESALNILRSLDFAQSVMLTPKRMDPLTEKTASDPAEWICRCMIVEKTETYL